MRTAYRYDPETCTYIEVKKDFRYYLRIVGLGLGLLCFFVVAGIGGYIYFFDTNETLLIKKQNRELISQTEQYTLVADSIEEKLSQLKTKDKKLYKTILNAEPEPEVEEKDSTNTTQKPKQALGTDELKNKLQALEEKLNNRSELNTVINELKRKDPEALKRIPSIRPINSEIISGFGKRKSPVTKADKNHSGVDFRANIGTSVKATGDGVVGETGNRNNGQGQFVSVIHADGYVSYYACLSQILVRTGQKVKRGDVIAKSGSSGLSKGPHLHYEIQRNGKPIDPIDFFYSEVGPNEYIQLKESASRYNESMD